MNLHLSLKLWDFETVSGKLVSCISWSTKIICSEFIEIACGDASCDAFHRDGIWNSWIVFKISKSLASFSQFLRSQFFFSMERSNFSLLGGLLENFLDWKFPLSASATEEKKLVPPLFPHAKNIPRPLPPWFSWGKGLEYVLEYANVGFLWIRFLLGTSYFCQFFLETIPTSFPRHPI